MGYQNIYLRNVSLYTVVEEILRKMNGFILIWVVTDFYSLEKNKYGMTLLD